MPRTDFSQIPTTTLIDLYESADDTELMEIYEELTNRGIFECLNNDIREREEEIQRLKDDVLKLKKQIRGHKHLPGGQAVEEL